jgi:arabinofuranosyltransferase
MSRIAARVSAVAAVALTFIGVVRSAALLDDAYITLRTIDNWIHGYGLRRNVVERVQTYTHPLWLFLLSSVYVITREPYYTTLAVSLVVTLATLLLVAFALPRSPWLGAAGVLALGASHAFVGYAAGGLENPLSSLLLVVLVLQLGRAEPTTRRLAWLGFTGALLVLTRPDFALLVAPLLAVELWTLRSWAALRALAFGLAPLFAWELFSFVYYGALVPNTAPAKLHHHVPKQAVLAQGRAWLWYTLRHDWGTALVVAWAAAVASWKRERWQLSCVAGLALYLAWCVRIGGDYSAGRLFVGPMVLALALVVRSASAWPALGLVAIAASTLWLAVRPVAFAGDPDAVLPSEHGIWDDHGYYYPHTALRHVGWHARGPLYEWGEWGQHEGNTPGRVLIFRAAGQYGYYAGPGIHIIDDLGICDPLLARLAPIESEELLPGHMIRAVPAGYHESVDGPNVIRDPALHELYDAIVEVTRGPIASWSRLKRAWFLSTGQYQYLARRYEQR